MDPAAEGTWGDRCDVVDEPFGFDIGQFDRHVAGPREQVFAIDGKDRRARPIIVGPLVEFLVPFEVQRTDRVVGHPEGEHGRIVGPG